MSKKGMAAIIVGVFLLAFAGTRPSVTTRIFGVPLYYRWKVGQTMRHRFAVVGNFKISMKRVPANTPEQAKALLGQAIPFTWSMTTRQSVTAVDSSGVADVETVVEGGDVNLDFFGQVWHRSTSTKSPPTRTRVDPKGALLQVKVPTPIESDQSRQLQQFLSELTGGFLTGDRRRFGSAWSQPINVALSNQYGSFELTGSMTNKLMALEMKNGATTAHLTREFETDVKLVPTADAPAGAMTLGGTLKGTGNNYFDWRHNVLIESDTSSVIAGDFVLTAGKAEFPGLLRTEFSTTLDRL